MMKSRLCLVLVALVHVMAVACRMADISKFDLRQDEKNPKVHFRLTSSVNMFNVFQRVRINYQKIITYCFQHNFLLAMMSYGEVYFFLRKKYHNLLDGIVMEAVNITDCHDEFEWMVPPVQAGSYYVTLVIQAYDNDKSAPTYHSLHSQAFQIAPPLLSMASTRSWSANFINYGALWDIRLPLQIKMRSIELIPKHVSLYALLRKTPTAVLPGAKTKHAVDPNLIHHVAMTISESQLTVEAKMYLPNWFNYRLYGPNYEIVILCVLYETLSASYEYRVMHIFPITMAYGSNVPKAAMLTIPEPTISTSNSIEHCLVSWNKVKSEYFTFEKSGIYTIEPRHLNQSLDIYLSYIPSNSSTDTFFLQLLKDCVDPYGSGISMHQDAQRTRFRYPLNDMRSGIYCLSCLSESKAATKRQIISDPFLVKTGNETIHGISANSVWAPNAVNGFAITMQRDMLVSSFRLELYNDVTLDDAIFSPSSKPFIAATEYHFSPRSVFIREQDTVYFSVRFGNYSPAILWKSGYYFRLYIEEDIGEKVMKTENRGIIYVAPFADSTLFTIYGDQLPNRFSENMTLDDITAQPSTNFEFMDIMDNVAITSAPALELFLVVTDIICDSHQCNTFNLTTRFSMRL